MTARVQVGPSVPVEVSPGRGPGLAAHVRLEYVFKDRLECTIPVAFAQDMLLAGPADKQVQETVSVVVDPCDSQEVWPFKEAGFLGDVFERTVSLIVVQII